MESSLFDQLVKSSIGFTLATEIEDVPEEPGIYAWYLPMRGDSSSNLLQYLKSLQQHMKETNPVTSMAGEGRQKRFNLERNHPSFDLASDVIQELANSLSSSKIQSLASAILILSFFTEPIYVGMTKSGKGLRGRLKQHLQSVKSFDDDMNWTGSFRTRVAQILNDPDYLKRCLIVYMPMSAVNLSDDSTRLIEHILIRTIRPVQSVRG